MIRSSDRLLSFQTAALQALYWMTFCPIYAFASVFLLAKNFSNQQIGWVIAISNILAVIMQPLLGALIDRIRTITVKTTMAVLTIIALVLLAGLILLKVDLLWMAVLYVGIGSLLITMQPLVTSLTFDYINAGRKVNFGITRAAGSGAFAILSTLLGYWVYRTSPEILPALTAGLCVVYLLVILSFPKVEKSHYAEIDSSQPNGPEKPAAGFLRRYDRFIPFLVGTTCLFVFHSIINTFLAQIMSSVNGKTTDLGISLTIAAAVEMPAFLGFSWIISKFKSTSLLKFSGIVYALRSFIFLLASSVFLVNIGQLFQALSFAVFIPASVYYINETMQPGDRVKGQTFVTGMATLGSVIGTVIGGRLLDVSGVPALLTFASAAAVAGALLMIFSTRRRGKATVEPIQTAKI